jgi:RNA polymerase sigma factor (sigma-70 family)
MSLWRQKPMQADSAPWPDAGATDAELVRAARRGEKRAFVEIVKRYQAMVCGIALGILGDFAASEDAGQEAFLTAWRKFSELREPEKLRGWLAQIARHAALGHLRRRKGHENLDDVAPPIDDAPGPDQTAASADEAALVRQSLAKLPETYRLPLILYYREGQSVRAVAEALEISEDAVKQRLARGREMLRERMEGLIEGVLVRTGPSPVFTMAVAAAIGALALPASVSAGVFAGSAAATTTGATTAATTTTSPLLTLMSTSKSLLATALVVAAMCVPVGYSLRPDVPDSPVRVTASPPAPAAAAPSPIPATIALSLGSSALFAEWRQLHEAHGTNSAAMPNLFKIINELKDPLRRRAFNAALVAEWVQVDPAEGLKFYLQKGRDSRLRRQFFDEWLASDPAKAVAALTTSGAGWEDVAHDALTDIARRHPASVAGLAARLPKPDSVWDTAVRDAFAVLAEGGLKTARESADKLSGPNREQALAGVARTWAKSDLDAAVQWAKALPAGIDSAEVIRAALVGKAGVDPVAALDLVDMVPPGGNQMHFASTTGARVLIEAARADFDATVGWLTEHPTRLGHADMIGLAQAVTERLNANAPAFLAEQAANGSLKVLAPAIDSALLNDSADQRAAVWNWLKTQPDSEVIRSLRSEVLHSAGYQDPELALSLAAELPRTPAGDEEVKSVARSLLNGGNAYYRLDNLLAQASERLREPLVEAAIQFLRTDNLGDPQRWIERLTQMPETARPQATEAIARAWAGRTPEEAANWAASLPPGTTRTSAEAAVVSGGAPTDPTGAAAWVESHAAGTGRDALTASLVSAIAETYPYDAWDWALSVSDPTRRVEAARQALKGVAARDAALARRWLENSAFPEAAKVELRAALANPRQP